MVSTWLFESTDPRDRVFALLGLPNSNSDPNTDNLFMEPNYSLTPSQVYSALAMRVLSREQSLRLFGAVQHVPGEQFPNPSWAPQWLPRSTEPLVPIDRIDNHGTLSLKENAPVFNIENDSLTVRGLQIDKVAFTTDVIRWDLAGYHLPEKCNWIQRTETLLQSQSHSLTRQRLQSLCWTLTVGRGFDVWSTRDNHWDYAQGLWLEAIKRFSSKNWSGIGRDSLGEDEGEGEQTQCGIHKFLGSATKGRRIFVTRKGTVGLEPASMEEGDIVTILLGSGTPFILRKQGEEFLLAGECYVHGQMDGEAIEQYEDGDREVEEFKLR
jgi:hypothetical protein